MTSTPHPGPHHHPRTSSLRVDTVLVDDRPCLRYLVDGADLLARSRNPRGPDPDRLLPPLSSALLPTAAGREVVLGTCTCGEPGCGALVARVRRVGSRVLWEPTTAERPAGGPAETLDRTLAFGLLPYLDAIDAAATDRGAVLPSVAGARVVLREGAGRRVARAVRLRLGGVAPGVAGVRWVSAWPWSSATVHLCLRGFDGAEQVRVIEPTAGEGEEAMTDRVCRLVEEWVADGALNG